MSVAQQNSPVPRHNPQVSRVESEAGLRLPESQPHAGQPLHVSTLNRAITVSESNHYLRRVWGVHVFHTCGPSRKV